MAAACAISAAIPSGTTGSAAAVPALIIALPAVSATTAAVPAMAAGMRRASVLPGSRLMSGSFIS